MIPPTIKHRRVIQSIRLPIEVRFASIDIPWYTFSVRPTIPESENLKIAMKRFEGKENEDFCEEDYFSFEELIFCEEKTF